MRFNKRDWDNWITTIQKMNLDPYLTPQRLTQSGPYIKLNVRAKTTKLLKENTGINLCCLGLGNDFSEKPPKAKATED